MKIKKRYIIATTLILVFIGLGLYIKMSGLWDMVFYNSKYEFEIINNPDASKYVTILLHTRNPWSVNSYTDTYAVPGKYRKNRIPEDGNFIKMLGDSALDLEWVDNDTIRVYATREPEVNNFQYSSIDIDLVIGRALFDEFQARKQY